MGHPWEEKWSVSNDKDEKRKGGQGIIRVATWEEDNTVRGVLKTLLNNKSESARSRMFREVAHLKSLGSVGANVPRVLDHNTDRFEDPNVELFVVMSFIPGATLKELVEAHGPLTIDQAVSFTLNLCKTIRVAHGQLILHRDLKPDNIIVRDPAAADLVIVDYGLSFNAGDDAVTETNETFRNKFLDLPETNTPGGDRRDARSDLTAVCAILLYCLTKGTPGHLLDSYNAAPHRRSGFQISELHPGDSRLQSLDDLFTRGFSVTLDNRFQTIEQLEQELQQLQKPTETDLSDPIQLAASLSRRLRVSNRKTQLASFAVHALEIMNEISRESHKYNDLGEFEFVMTPINAAPGQIRLPATLDLVPGQMRSVKLNLRQHALSRGVLFCLCSRGDRCVLSCFKTHSEPAIARGFGGGQSISYVDPVEVGTFDGKPEQVFPLLSMFIRKWLVSAMTELTEEVSKDA